MPIPNLSAVQQHRWDQAVKAKSSLIGSPELVIEVASPSNRKLHRKAEGYLEHGAEQVWIIYPSTQTVTVMTPDGASESRLGESIEFRGVQVLIRSLFAID